MTTAFVCCDDERRTAVLESALNGIDYLEVSTDQKTLDVHFLKPLGSLSLDKRNVLITGGERVLDPPVKSTSPGGDVLTVKVFEPGDFSPYTLRLVTNEVDLSPPAGIDPLLGVISFSFKVNCDTTFDCRPERECAVEEPAEPEIDYLAKDYASFRRLMLDRLSVLMPTWRERSAADLGVALVELLAYVADQLSYRQDAVATEAYLGTARRRVSVRRHARLVDYLMHDGCNARTWARIELAEGIAGPVLVPGPDAETRRPGTKLLTSVPGQPPVLTPADLRAALGFSPEVFETMEDVTCYGAHAEIPFYAWGARRCCLPTGTTRATLRGDLPNLAADDVLVFVELLGPETGDAADADPAHRHAVRLTSVAASSDPIGGRFLDPPTDDPVPVTEIAWHAEDALPFPLCISAETKVGYVEDVSHAFGNVVLADHGRSVKAEEDLPGDRVEQLGVVPKPRIFFPPASGDRCERREPVSVPPRFRPPLAEKPLTQAVPHLPERPDPDAEPPSATAVMRSEPSAALPAITLDGLLDGTPSVWHPLRDLLDSGPSQTRFVVEVESDDTAFIRFGDDRFGLRPTSGTSFAARYRVGNGRQGNIGAGALVHIVVDVGETRIAGVTNPMPATGGVDPETAERVRQSAPFAFRAQERAVTLADYGEVTQRAPGVQRAAASTRWTGSWRTVFVSVDRLGGLEVDRPFRRDVLRHLERYRMAGQDVDVDKPRFVSLEVEMFVCVEQGYFRSDVERALRTLFSSRVLPDGRRGLFHPDNFTFGQSVYLSPLYAVAQGVPGVAFVDIRKFQRLGSPASDARETGVLPLARLEIARLDQDPDFPEHGKLTMIVGGGK